MSEEQVKYHEFVQSLIKEPCYIHLGYGEINLVHMALGVAGEAGELVDAIKKAAIYGQNLDEENVAEEIGDILFYCVGICNELGFSLSYCIDANVDKLKQRYPGKYSDYHAKARLDKTDE